MLFKKIFLIAFSVVLNVLKLSAQQHLDYSLYHQQVLSAEKLISQERFADALHLYNTLIGTHEFVFLSDYKIATQLTLSLGQEVKTSNYLREAVLGGSKSRKKLEWTSTCPEHLG